MRIESKNKEQFLKTQQDKEKSKLILKIMSKVTINSSNDFLLEFVTD